MGKIEKFTTIQIPHPTTKKPTPKHTKNPNPQHQNTVHAGGKFMTKLPNPSVVI